MSLTLSLAAISQQRPDSGQSQSAVQVPAVAKYGELPLAFEANRGQTDASVRFLAGGNGYSLYLTDSEAILALHKPSNCPLPKTGAEAKTGSCAGKTGTKPDVVRMKLAGVAATLSAKAAGEDELPGKVNYFFGNDPTKWHTNLPTYKRVRYASVYPGVDLVYYGNQRQLEYDFIVAPHADPRLIQLRFSGAVKLSLTSAGDLTVISRDGQIALQKPQIYQETNGRRRVVRGHFILMANHAIGFAVGSYDHAQTLVIDPVLVYSTYLGGDYFDPVQGITVDSSGNAYVVGYSSSYDFPVTPGAYNVNGCGAFVTKLNATGTALIYSTRLAGTCLDTADGIAVDGSGNAYVTGGTQSNFPVTPGAFQTTKESPYPTWTGFVSKLDPTGSTLLYSTYLGGSSGEGCCAIALDGAGNAYVAGFSQSTDFPVTPGAFQTVKKGGASNAIVSVLNATGTALLYSTFIGGSGSSFGGDSAMDIKLDSSGNAYVTGYTQSFDFPVTPGAFQSTLKGGCNAFIAKINPTLSKLVYSTYLGGSGATLAGSSLQPCSGDFAQGIALDKSGNAYVAGSTTSDDFPVTEGAFQTTNKNSQGTAFVAEMNQDGSELLYSTYLGGSGDGSYGDFATSLGVDSVGDAYVTGWTSSFDFPVTPGAFQRTNGFVKVFATKLNPTGTGLLYSTFLGGRISVGWGPYPGDEAWAAALDASNNFYVVGVTQSTDFPVTPGAYQTTNNAAATRGHTGFVTKMSLIGKITPTLTVSPSATSIMTTQALTVTVAVSGGTGAPAPTGTVTMAGGGYTSSTGTLSGGSYTFTVPANSLRVGSDTLTVTYSGDTNYVAGTATACVAVTASPLTPSVTVTPAATALNSGSPLSVLVLVTGSSVTPTGTVTVSGSGYTSSAGTLSSGSYTFNIPANTLSAGTDSLIVSYSGDSIYTAGTGTASVSVTQSLFSMAASIPSSINPGATAVSTITVSTATGYAGTVTVACALTSNPVGATHLPTCSNGSSPITLSGTNTSGTVTVNVITTGAATAIVRPGEGRDHGWAGAGGGAILAVLIFLGIPTRRRNLQSLVGVLLVMVILGGMAGCGGGGGGGGGGATTIPGTTAGTYTFTVTGTGSPSLTPVPTATFTLTVN